MSASGHEQTSRHVRVMSVIPLKADIHRRGLHVRPLASVSGCPCRSGLPVRFRWGRSTASRERQMPHFSLSRIFSSPARAQVSSNLAPGAPLAPIAPMVSSPSLMTTPPPKNITCGSLDNGAISPLPRSSKAIVSLLNETLV